MVPGPAPALELRWKVERGAKWNKLCSGFRDRVDKLIEKAQENADVDAILRLKTMRQSPTDRHDISGVPEAKALLDVFDKQLEGIANALVVKGLGAAKNLNAVLENKKRGLVKKDSLDSAKALAEFQKNLETWAVGIKSGGLPNFDFATTENEPPSTAGDANEQIVVVDAKRIEGTPIGEFEDGDVLEIQYVGGKWTRNAGPWFNPDRSFKQVLLIKVKNVLETTTSKSVSFSQVAVIPENTKEAPVFYTVERPHDGKLSLVIAAYSFDSSSQAGFARYRVKVHKRSEGFVPPPRKVPQTRSH